MPREEIACPTKKTIHLELVDAQCSTPRRLRLSSPPILTHARPCGLVRLRGTHPQLRVESREPIAERLGRRGLFGRSVGPSQRSSRAWGVTGGGDPLLRTLVAELGECDLPAGWLGRQPKVFGGGEIFLMRDGMGGKQIYGRKRSIMLIVFVQFAVYAGFYPKRSGR